MVSWYPRAVLACLLLVAPAALSASSISTFTARGQVLKMEVTKDASTGAAEFADLWLLLPYGYEVYSVKVRCALLSDCLFYRSDFFSCSDVSTVNVAGPTSDTTIDRTTCGSFHVNHCVRADGYLQNDASNLPVLQAESGPYLVGDHTCSPL